MAKKIGISVDAWEGKHYKRVNKYARQIDDIFSTLSQEAGIIGASVTNFNPNKPFTFTDYPNTKQRIDKLLSNLQNNISLVVNDGTREEWLLACQKNDAIVKNVFNNQKLDKVRLEHYYSRNLEALDAFQKRKVNGMNLSDRVWNLTDQTKQELEMSIDLGLTDGKSASQMGREIKKHLNDPNKLFRRVKDERGVLQLSKNAKAYHPGQGVYRSSKANAMRLTRTETNMAYRASDNERWNQLDFILGYEIKRSNNPYPCPVCEALKGKYPKTFKFVGWHPNCRCFQVPILADLNDFLDYETKILDGEDVSGYDFKNEITELPDNFTQWVSQNSQTLASRKSVPYFIRDNFKSDDIKKGLKLATDDATLQKPTKAEPVKVSRIPKELEKDSNYLKNTDIEFSNEFFELVDWNDPIKLKITEKGKGAYYQPSTKTVNIVNDSRVTRSQWERQAVIYHEFGHGIDWQRGLRLQDDVKTLMDKHRTLLSKKETRSIRVREYDYKLNKYVYKKTEVKVSGYAYADERLKQLSTKIWNMKPELFEKRGISKFDVLEQIGSTRDTIMSLNRNFGFGHSKAYFKNPQLQSAEFLAHAFENKFVGNAVFKKYLPDLYADMIKYVEKLKKL